jgi:hypothetical protein
MHAAIFSNNQLKYEYMKKVDKNQYLFVTGEIRGAGGAWRKGERPKGALGPSEIEKVHSTPVKYAFDFTGQAR